MKLLVAFVSLSLIAASVARVQKRDVDSDLEQLLRDIKGGSSEDGHGSDQFRPAEGRQDSSQENHDSSPEGHSPGEPPKDRGYEYRSDIFEEVRWEEVYADKPDARDYIEGRVMNSLTAAQAKEIVDLHNKLRKQEGSSNMEILRYNEKLARLGQTWSQRCVFEHGQPPFSESDIGHKNLGQNIYAHSNPNFKVSEAVQAWYDEKKDYQYNSASCNAGKVCGHYTAVTWAKTTDVGCGITFCPSISGLTKAHYIVCNYAPAGNFQGEKPFLKGSPCTQCDSGKFYCNDNMCDSRCSSESGNCKCKAECKNGGKKTNDCKCECKSGSTGPNCADACQDKDPKCGQNPGYPEMLCNMNDPNWAFVKEKCPKLCKKCKSKRTSDNDLLKRLMLGILKKELDEE